MQADTKLRKVSINLQIVRKLHRFFTLYLLFFIFTMSVTGLLLGWKKNFYYLQAPTLTGVSTNPDQWRSINSIVSLALQHARNLPEPIQNAQIDRIDVRPTKGMAKVLFKDTYLAFQIDLTTGAILSVEQRRSDFIEQLHDGSIVDDLMGWGSGAFKLFYTTVSALAMLFYAITGFWLWFAPKRIVKLRD